MTQAPTGSVIHHLGDGIYKGNPKYIFNSLVEGTTYRKIFKLEKEPSTLTQSTFSIMHRGCQLTTNSIFINNVQATTIPTSPEDGSFALYTYDVPPEYFRLGMNEFKVESAFDEDGQFDDFEFKDSKIEFDVGTPDLTGNVATEEEMTCGGPGGDSDYIPEEHPGLDTDVIDDCGSMILEDGTIVPISGQNITDGDVFTNPNVTVQGGRRPTDHGENQFIRKLAPEVETRDTDTGENLSIWGGW